MTTARINLMAQVILLHTKLCKMYRVYCLNYILNESQVNMKDTNFVSSLLRCVQSFLEWAQIIKYFYTHCILLKIIIRDMLFPTKLTSLINTRWLIDSGSLKIISGSHKWPKTFLGGVYIDSELVVGSVLHYATKTRNYWITNGIFFKSVLYCKQNIPVRAMVLHILLRRIYMKCDGRSAASNINRVDLSYCDVYSGKGRYHRMLSVSFYTRSFHPEDNCNQSPRIRPCPRRAFQYKDSGLRA